jgi:NADPH-dependent 2,4-dienoyl-CoA reductase/sulfur reductase-like enzyme
MDDSFAAADFIASHKPERALIIGAGYIGLEMADALRHQKIGVTVVEQLPSVLPTVDRELGDALGTYIESHGVEVKTGVRIQEIGREGDALRVTGDDGFDRRVDMVLVVVGVKPVTELAKAAGIATGLRGAIIVNRSMATNVNDIYAAGDCVVTYHRLLNADTYMPLGTTAHKQGRVAGESAAGGQARYGGSLGTQVVKVFDWAVARTGLRDHEARSAGYHPVTVEFSTWDHKAYYPGAHRLTFRITGDEITGQLLGAQLMGHWQGAVAKRVDIFAMALYHQMSVADILEADLSYTPPLGSPWDAVQMAAEHWQKHRQDT